MPDVNTVLRDLLLGPFYVLNFTSSAVDPADATPLFVGGSGLTTAVEGLAKIRFRHKGHIMAADVSTLVLGTLGSAELSTAAIRLNATTDYVISAAVSYAAQGQMASNAALNGGVGVPFATGDTIEIKVTPPTWGTNPTTVVHFGSLLIRAEGL